MNRLIHSGVLLLCLLAAGCNARQGASVEPEQAAELGKQVKIYRAADLTGAKYTSLGRIEASACRWMLWDKTPTEEAVTSQLLVKAAEMSANGIANVSCSSGTASALVKDCWSRVECTAEAVVANGSKSQEVGK
jgi:hypothetical protein